MTFANPTILWALLLVPLTLIFLGWAERSREAAIQKLGDPSLIQRLSLTVNWSGRKWQTRLWLLALVLTLLALARPQWGSEVQVVKQEGVQVMVALDVSKSMLAQDIKPDRLTRAKMEISDLMNKLDGDEIGLTLFSGASFIQFPLTNDYDTARSFLESASPNSISRPGTEMGAAIRTAMSGFDNNHNSQRVIVIITDGENHQPDAIAEAQAAAQEGVLIYTIGFGSTEGEPIPEYAVDGSIVSYKTDETGQTVLSRLDETTLQEIAQIGHGKYFRAAANGSELDDLVNELNNLQSAQLESRLETTKIERFQIFLAGAVLALIMAEVIPAQVKAKTTSQEKKKKFFSMTSKQSS